MLVQLLVGTGLSTLAADAFVPINCTPDGLPILPRSDPGTGQYSSARIRLVPSVRSCRYRSVKSILKMTGEENC